MSGITMGSILQSKCKCGFESDELFLGSGLVFSEDRELPFFCDNCEMVFTRNIIGDGDFKKYNRCPTCRKKVQYYGSISRDDFGCDGDYVFDWGLGSDKRYYLKSDNHHCPKCKIEKMKFHLVGHWD